MLIALDYFDPNGQFDAYNDISVKYPFPKIKGIHSRNAFDEFMDESMQNTLSTTYTHENEEGDGVKLIAAGMPIEFIQRKMQKLKKPMLWIEFAMSIKNYFSDKHAQNLANQVPLICDIKEFIWTPYARKTKYNSWDSTIEMHEMIECVTPQFYDILMVQQSEYLFNNIVKLLQEEDNEQEEKRIVLLTGQGVAHLLNQHLAAFMRASNKEKRQASQLTMAN